MIFDNEYYTHSAFHANKPHEIEMLLQILATSPSIQDMVEKVIEATRALNLSKRSQLKLEQLRKLCNVITMIMQFQF